MKLVGRLAGTRRTVELTVRAETIVGIRDVAAKTDVWICPGLVDIQNNGYAGNDVRDLNVDESTISRLVTSQWEQGVTAVCPTVTTAPEDRMVRSLRAIAGARKQDAIVARSIPCAHVEGPHLSAEDGPRGAHDARWLRPPDVAEFQRWQGASGGIIGIVTLAPELPGSAAYIREVSGAGTVVALGHTAARPDDVAAAVSAGARLSTHLGNGAHAVIPRHPNYIWEQLADGRLMASFIADGHHLPASTLSAMVRAKGTARSILVSDSVALAGMPPGRYEGPTGLPVELGPDGRLALAGTTLLAGAVRNLRECLAWAVHGAGIGFSRALAMAAANPARLLSDFLPGPRQIVEGAGADLTLLRNIPDQRAIDVVATVVGGVVVHSSDDAPIEHRSTTRNSQ